MGAAPRPVVLGLTGRAGAGKSTAAAHLVAHHGFVRRPFAALLKGMLRSLLLGQGVPAAAVERMIDGDGKELPTRHLGGQTPRRAMQLLGTEWGRGLAPDLWVDMWAASIAGLDRVVADDVRFDNEAAAIRALGGTVVEIRRPGLARLAGGHVSEAGVAADTVVVNDASAVEGLSRGLDRLVGLGWADRDREGS